MLFTPPPKKKAKFWHFTFPGITKSKEVFFAVLSWFTKLVFTFQRSERIILLELESNFCFERTQNFSSSFSLTTNFSEMGCDEIRWDLEDLGDVIGRAKAISQRESSLSPGTGSAYSVICSHMGLVGLFSITVMIEWGHSMTVILQLSSFLLLSIHSNLHNFLILGSML